MLLYHQFEVFCKFDHAVDLLVQQLTRPRCFLAKEFRLYRLLLMYPLTGQASSKLNLRPHLFAIHIQCLKVLGKLLLFHEFL